MAVTNRQPERERELELAQESVWVPVPARERVRVRLPYVPMLSQILDGRQATAGGEHSQSCCTYFACMQSTQPVQLSDFLN